MRENMTGGNGLSAFMKNLVFLVPMITLLVALGIAYGMLRSDVDHLRTEVADLKESVKYLPAMQADIKYIKDNLDKKEFSRPK